MFVIKDEDEVVQGIGKVKEAFMQGTFYFVYLFYHRTDKAPVAAT